MYSPKIDQHTPNIYRLAKLVGKPMTKVADELISFGLNNLTEIYSLNDEQQAKVFLGDKSARVEKSVPLITKQ